MSASKKIHLLRYLVPAFRSTIEQCDELSPRRIGNFRLYFCQFGVGCALFDIYISVLIN